MKFTLPKAKIVRTLIFTDVAGTKYFQNQRGQIVYSDGVPVDLNTEANLRAMKIIP